MATLVTGFFSVDGDGRYFTSDQLSLLLDVPKNWVEKRAAEGVIRPALTRGRHQYNRGARLRLCAYQILQNIFGSKSSLPARVIKDIGPRLDELGNRDELHVAETVFELGQAMKQLIWSPEVVTAMERDLKALATEPENAA